jgi:hypothetical protein
MRSVGLLAAVVLFVVLVASLFSPVAGQVEGEVWIHKVTTNGDETTMFRFERNGSPFTTLYGGTDAGGLLLVGDHTFVEVVPAGWALVDVNCVATASTFDYIEGGVTVHLVAGDYVSCTFTNSPVPNAGVLAPIELCVIQWGVEEQNGTVSWWPGFAYLDVPISQCQDKTDYFTDVLDRTIVIHLFNQTRIS